MVAADKLAVSTASLWSTLYLVRHLGNICARAALVHTFLGSGKTALLYERREYTECRGSRITISQIYRHLGNFDVPREGGREGENHFEAQRRSNLC